MVKALVTGASGFVGGYLVDYLEGQGCKVWGTFVDKAKTGGKGFIKMNLIDPSEVQITIKNIKPDVVFHLAGISSVSSSWKQIHKTYETNAMGTINLAESILLYSPETTLINIGSSEEYGIPNMVPTSENHSTNPVTPYGVSKLAAGLSVLQFYQKYSLKGVHVRAFNHIGPGQPEGFVTTDFAKQIVDIEKGKISEIISVGNLSAKRDFTDVRDVVRAYWDIYLNGKLGEVYNVCSGKSVSISDILLHFVSFSDIKIKIIEDPNKFRVNDVPTIQGNGAKLFQDTGWTPEISIENSLKQILDYWRNEPKGFL